MQNFVTSFSIGLYKEYTSKNITVQVGSLAEHTFTMCTVTFWGYLDIVALVVYVLVIAPAQGIYAIYCTEARGRFVPEG